jgi:hypothetical protein
MLDIVCEKKTKMMAKINPREKGFVSAKQSLFANAKSLGKTAFGKAFFSGSHSLF